MSRKSHAHRRPKRRRRRRPPRNRWRTASTSDKYELYESAVQDAQVECDLILQVWKERRGRRPHHIREDFCGTALVSTQWVRQSRAHTAIGIDIDPVVLDWARARIPDRLTASQQKRLCLVQEDVRTTSVKKVDSVLAMNFSSFIFKTRDAMRQYFQSVRRSLVDDGLFLLDAYGGSDSFVEMEEDRNLDGFTYIWDQHLYNPITGDVINHIHFEFPDGTKLKKAFTYDWRLWTLPELRELLLEAGFKDAVVYWEGTDAKTGEGDGDWKVSNRGEACEGWIAYVVAER